MLQRKLLLISLFTVMALFRLSADTVTVHGYVAGVNGDPVENVPVTITAFFADSTGIFETVTTNSDGIYQYEFEAPNNILGWLQVGMVNCWGTWLSLDTTITTTPAEFVADFEYCENITIDSCIVIINEVWNPGALPQLVAWTPFASPATYTWTTGETTEAITPQQSGEYCVTVTFPFGCEAVDCYTFQDTFPNCFAYISANPNQDGTYTLVAGGVGQAPYSYLWDDGSTSDTIFNAGPGSHCVTVTDATDCSFGTCIFLQDPNFCEVWIYQDPGGVLFAQSYGIAPFTYLWSTNETSEFILPVSPGLYCVTTTDATGCTASSCIDYAPFDSCYVYVYAYLHDSSTIALYAAGDFFWGDSATFDWSNGGSGQIIYITDLSQEYCVTMTTSSGCIASACFDPASICYAAVDVQYIDPENATLSVWVDPIFGAGGTPVSYLWFDGSSDPTVNVSESGSYCVTVTIGDDCVTEACTYVDFDSLQYNCAAWVFTYPDSNGNWLAEAYAWGPGVFDYVWNTGDTTPVIQLSFPNAYACVTVTNNFGCEAVACSDSLFNQCEIFPSVNYISDEEAILSAYVWGGNGSYTWSNGATGPEITVSESGTYCVTYVGQGCTNTACIDVYFWNSDTCYVYIESIPLPTGGIQYTAYPYQGEAPFTYAWSNGATEQSQIVDFGIHDLCVTVTDATGCVASACNFKFDSCYTALEFQNFGTPQIVIQTATPLLYAVWTNGDTTQNVLEITETGWYCVTVYDIYGCVDSTCIEVVNLDPTEGQNIITGFITADSIWNLQGIVYAYSVDPNGGAFELVDSTVFYQSYYAFQDMPNGLYLLKASIAPGTIGYDQYMPTYHFSSAEWSEADPHALPNYPQVTTDIRMIPIDTTNGTGVIGGIITDPTGFTAGEGEHSRNGEGLAGVTILLSDEYGTPKDFTISGEDGVFTFPNLAFGTYRITYDIPGIQSPDIWITLSAENPENSSVVLIVENSVAVEEPTSIEVSIAPNPAKHEINITLPATLSSFDVQVVDMQGRIVKAGSVRSNNGILNIGVDQFASGLYHINLRSNDQMYFGRFVKQE